jgi:hypothetical protein
VTDPIGGLRRELVAAARREAARSRPQKNARPSWRVARRWRTALVLVVLLVLASGTAVAASQLFGPPVRSGLVLTGGAKPGPILLAPLRVADPAGGFPWGVRIYTPRRRAPGAGRVSCVQIGRVLDGRLGVIGEDGAFGDDGLFHLLPVEPLTGCVHAATASTAIWYPGFVPASAFTGIGSCAVPPARGANGRTAEGAPSAQACPVGDLRLVVYGIANARAKSVRLASSFGVHSERLVAADHGAFIFVLAASDAHASATRFRVTFGY